MKDFVAIDFETANFNQSSICSVGIVIVKDGEIVDNFYSLVRPVPNYYNSRCSDVNGMCYNDTCGERDFPDVWVDAQRKIHEYFPYIEDGEVPFVAHNARFDEGCLRAAFATFELAFPNYEFRDTLAASRNYFGSALLNHQLHTVAAACGYDLQNHHHALADAEACAWIAREII